MPLIIYFQARFGIVGPKTQREQWRIAIVGIAVLAALFNPSIYPVTMLLTMVPLLILYLIIFVLSFFGALLFNKTFAIDNE
jgi:Sec-independent protein secretion pathway component TatC